MFHIILKYKMQSRLDKGQKLCKYSYLQWKLSAEHRKIGSSILSAKSQSVFQKYIYKIQW